MNLGTLKEKYTIEKKMAVILGGIFVLSLIPLLIIAYYNVMCADDYSYGKMAHQAYMECHSILACLKAAMKRVQLSYFEWQGTYSAIFLMALQPGIISEQLYFLTTYFVLFLYIGGTIYFSRVLFRKGLDMDIHLVIIILAIFFICTIQWIPAPSQAFYWYNGSIYYMGFHGIMMFYFGLLLKNILNDKCSILVMVSSLVIGFILGGGNYVTALLTMELSLMLIFICWKSKKNRIVRLIIPVIVNGVGFFISVIAPGNQIRQQYFLDTKLDVWKSILYSFINGISCINSWMNIWIVLGLALLVPFVWRVVTRVSCEWRYPGLVIIFSFCIFASSFTPTLYALGSAGAGRVQNIRYVYFIIMLFVDLFYIEGWISKQLEMQLLMTEKVSRYYILLILFCLGSSFIFMPDKGNLISYSAMRSLFVGEAKMYKQEADDRIAVLNENGNIAELKGFTVRPYVLYFDDITEDVNDWRNQAVANWYGKEKVIKK